jgi:hypothetical protein
LLFDVLDNSVDRVGELSLFAHERTHLVLDLVHALLVGLLL